MLQTTYLTVDDLKSYTPISQNVDTSQLENWIPVAEEMHIIGILGTALDTQLKTQIENGTISGDNYTLWTTIKNCSAWYTFYEATTFLRTKAMNKGIVQQFSDNSNVAPMEDFKDYKQSILDKAMFYRNYLIDFLEANKSLYPLWRSDSNDCGENHDKEFSGGIYV